MIPASFDYQDPADTERGWDDETTSVEECVHGEHPLECSLCTSSGLIAAVSGEGEDMQDPDKSHLTGNENTVEDRMAEDIGAWIAGASALALRHAYFAIEREVERRKNEIAQEAKQLEAFDKPVRATRKDKGTTRRKPEAA